MKPGFVVIALGGAGANYLKTLADDDEHIASRILIDTESPYPDLDDPLREDAVVRFLRLRPLQGIPFERQAHALLDAIEPMLRALIAESEMIVVCAGLGGVVGTSMAPALVAWLRKEFRNTPLVCNLTVPFAHEGRKRQDLALHAASAIMQSGASTLLREQ